jgi:hypothetical protein
MQLECYRSIRSRDIPKVPTPAVHKTSAFTGDWYAIGFLAKMNHSEKKHQLELVN